MPAKPAEKAVRGSTEAVQHSTPCVGNSGSCCTITQGVGVVLYLDE